MTTFDVRGYVQRKTSKMFNKGAAMSDVAFAYLREGLHLFATDKGQEIKSVVLSKTEGDGIKVDWGPGIVEMKDIALRDAAEMFNGYAELHLAKNPPDSDKADRNIRMAQRLYEALGEGYTPPETPQDAPGAAQEPLSVPAEPEVTLKVSDAPLDRRAVLAWIDTKLDGCVKHGMSDAYNVMKALKGDLANHLEDQPLDIELALRNFYADAHGRNVKAGWWTDLKTNEPKKRSVGELFILMVTEMAEAYNAYLTGEPDDKLPQYPGLGVELGDLQIRLADFCGALAEGRIVRYTGAANAGDAMFQEIVIIAERYEAIRKTPKAVGEIEMGEHLEPADVAVMVTDKLAFNATREDHKIENRLKEGGKQT